MPLIRFKLIKKRGEAPIDAVAANEEASPLQMITPISPMDTGEQWPGGEPVRVAGTPAQLAQRSYNWWYPPGSLYWYLNAPPNRLVSGWLLLVTLGAFLSVMSGLRSSVAGGNWIVIALPVLAVIDWIVAIPYFRGALADAKAGRFMSRATLGLFIVEVASAVAGVVGVCVVLFRM